MACFRLVSFQRQTIPQKQKVTAMTAAADASFWNKIARKYAKRPIDDKDSYQVKLKITQEYLEPDMSVLELGCGTGSTALIHAPHVRHILATDISSEMIAIAEEKLSADVVDNVTFQQATLDDITPPEGGFDAVLALNLFHLLDDPEAAMTRVNAMLKPGGVLVQSTGCLKDMGLIQFAIPVMQFIGKAPYVASFSESDLTLMTERAGFQIVHHWRPGKMAAVFLVARKTA